MALRNNTALGQHWLRDRSILAAIADEAELTPNDTVLEIGPGLGTLTSELLRRAGRVIAVEYDADLARKLPGQFPGKNLTVVNEDILIYDINSLGKREKSYKVVANVPYYITSKIIDRLITAEFPPEMSVLLVQKEVAERLAAGPGALSLAALNAQLYCEVSLGVVIGRDYFTPVPDVDSQVVILRRRETPLVPEAERPLFWRLARAGFAERRKKLQSSLAGGLHISKEQARQLLTVATLDPDQRAQDLSIAEWRTLAKVWSEQ